MDERPVCHVALWLPHFPPPLLSRGRGGGRYAAEDAISIYQRVRHFRILCWCVGAMPLGGAPLPQALEIA